MTISSWHYGLILAWLQQNFGNPGDEKALDLIMEGEMQKGLLICQCRKGGI